MKLIVQIPCFNEEATIARTIADIPRAIEGIDAVEVLIVDDGSTDRTAEVARAAGADHVVRNTANMGLAATFARGLEASLERGADIIVNTDGDNQYDGACIPDLVRPIVECRADVAIGDRQTETIEHFSPFKKMLQRVGSGVIRSISGLDVRDAVSGFRAYSREAAIRTNVMSRFSYTIETIIQAGATGLVVASVPVRVRAQTRPSRLFRSIPHFLSRQGVTLVRAYVMYRSLTLFSAIGAVLVLVGALPVLRFLVFYALGDGGGHLQSLVLGGVLILAGTLAFALALLADAIAMNRRLLEANLTAMRRLALDERLGRGGLPAGHAGQAGVAGAAGASAAASLPEAETARLEAATEAVATAKGERATLIEVTPPRRTARRA
ncbi:MAG: glycosyltransferase family 2 protein [Pseudomonadota bacterium]